MNYKEFIQKYEELLNSGYCECNELNCLDNNPPKKILNIMKEQQQEIERLNNTIKGLDNTIENLEEVIDKLEKYIEKETRIYGLSMSIELGTHFDNILDILKEVE